MLCPVAEGIKASTGLRQRTEQPACPAVRWCRGSCPVEVLVGCLLLASLVDVTMISWILHLPACLRWGWTVPERSLKWISITPSYGNSVAQSFLWAGIGQLLIPSTWEFLLCSSPVFTMVLPNCEDEKQLIYSNYFNIFSSVQEMASWRTCRDVTVRQYLYLVLSYFIVL